MGNPGDASSQSAAPAAASAPPAAASAPPAAPSAPPAAPPAPQALSEFAVGEEVEYWGKNGMSPASVLSFADGVLKLRVDFGSHQAERDVTSGAQEKFNNVRKAGGAETQEDKGLLGGLAGAAAGFGGMKVTGADDKLGFLGKAGVVAGAALAGHLLQDHLTGGGKKGKKGGKKDKKGGKDKKDKKSKKGHKSRDLDGAEESSSEESSDEEEAAKAAPAAGYSQAAAPAAGSSQAGSSGAGAAAVLAAAGVP